MKCQAAVLRGVSRPWEVTEITLDPPRAGEVMVRMAVAGICHSDDHVATGDSVPDEHMVHALQAAGVPTPDWFPFLGGHEGAGVVAEVGRGVSSLQPGDHVATSFMPLCGRCRWCATGMSYLCDNGAHLFDKSMTTDSTARRHVDGRALAAMTQLGTFAEYMVVSEQSLIKIKDTIPFHAASLVSCGVTTGWGSATVGAGTEAADTVVVIGIGGVGMNAVQGARSAGAKYIVGVDPVVFKRETVATFGATHTCSSAAESIDLVRELTNGVMADRVILTPGVLHADLISQAMMLTRKGGTCVVTGITPLTEVMVPLSLPDLVSSAKVLKGVLNGNLNPRASMPMLLSLYETGALKLDELVTRRYRLDEINAAVADLRAGRNIRGVIEFEAA